MKKNLLIKIPPAAMTLFISISSHAWFNPQETSGSYMIQLPESHIRKDTSVQEVKTGVSAKTMDKISVWVMIAFALCILLFLTLRMTRAVDKKISNQRWD